MEDRNALHTKPGHYEIVDGTPSDPANVRAELVFKGDDGSVEPTGHYSERPRDGLLHGVKVKADLKPRLDIYNRSYTTYRTRIELIGKPNAIQGNAALEGRSIPASLVAY